MLKLIIFPDLVASTAPPDAPGAEACRWNMKRSYWTLCSARRYLLRYRYKSTRWYRWHAPWSQQFVLRSDCISMFAVYLCCSSLLCQDLLWHFFFVHTLWTSVGDDEEERRAAVVSALLQDSSASPWWCSCSCSSHTSEQTVRHKSAAVSTPSKAC